MFIRSFLLFVVILFCFGLTQSVYAADVINSISVGDQPIGIDITPDGSKLYVVNTKDSSVSVIDVDSETVIKTILMSSGSRPQNAVVSPNGTNVYVTERFTGKVKVIDVQTDTVVDEIVTLSNTIDDVTFTPDGLYAYIGSDDVSAPIRMTIIDTQSRDVVGSIVTNTVHDKIVFNSNGTVGYVKVADNSSPSGKSTEVYDLVNNTHVGDIEDTWVFAVSNDGEHAWGAAVSGNSSIDYIDLSNNTIVDRVHLDQLLATGIAVNAEMTRFYISHPGSGHVSVYDSVDQRVIESIEVNGNQPVGTALSKDKSKLFVVLADTDEVEVFDLGDSGETKTLKQLIVEILLLIENGDFKKPVKNSYLAHLKKVEDLYDFGRYTPAKNQLNQFVTKLIKDAQQGNITGEQFSELLVLANDILVLLQEAEAKTGEPDVPLITQIASPYPPASADWESDTYGNGNPDWCGDTIGGCGCAITSLTMVAQKHGLKKDRDGNEVNPRNLNAWLTENNGYTPDNRVLWYYSLQYLSNKLGFSQLQLDHINTTDDVLVAEYLNNKSPAVAFKESKGHYLVLTDLLEGGGYKINDPLWYLTKTTNDLKDTVNHVQNYGNAIDRANLFSYTKNPRPFPSWVEIHLGSPAELLLTDEHGRRTGYDPETGEILTEIPGSAYVQTAGVVSQDVLPAVDHLDKVLTIHNPENDLYGLEVIGTDDGSYNLTVSTNGGENSSEVAYVASSTSLGAVDHFVVDVPDKNKVSRAPARLREVASRKDSTLPDVADHLREIADRLESKNTAATQSLFHVILP